MAGHPIDISNIVTNIISSYLQLNNSHIIKKQNSFNIKN